MLCCQERSVYASSGTVLPQMDGGRETHIAVRRQPLWPADGGVLDAPEENAHSCLRCMRIHAERSMPKSSVNLSIETSTLERARRYGERHDVSISSLVGDFLARLPADEDTIEIRGPITRSLLGIAKGAGDEEDYYRFLEEKYAR